MPWHFHCIGNIKNTELYCGLAVGVRNEHSRAQGQCESIPPLWKTMRHYMSKCKPFITWAHLVHL